MTPENNISSLIPVREQAKGRPTVNARDLHAFLQNGDHFATWIKERIKQYGFVENEDYVRFSASAEKGRKAVEYHLSLEMGRELAMVEKSEKGREARRYFIACEKELRDIQASSRQPSLSELKELMVARAMKMIPSLLPLSRYGDLNRDGRPKLGLRRAAFVAARSRIREAQDLLESMPLLALFDDMAS